MPQPLVRRPPLNANGKLSPQGKLKYIADKLGLQGITMMQGSTVNIFDTVFINTSAAARTTYNFFTNTQGKSRNFSNFQNGKLGAGEAMVFEQIQFFIVTCSAATYVDSTTMSALAPFSAVDSVELSLKSALQMGIMNIQIANSRVVKDYMINEVNPSFNPKTTGIALDKILTSADAAQYPEEVIGQNTIYLDPQPVLPPDQSFSLTLELPPVGTVTGNLAIVCSIGRFGSIFAANTTL